MILGRHGRWESGPAVGGSPLMLAEKSEQIFEVRVRKRPQREYSRKGAGPVAGILTPSPNATDGATCATRREAWATGFDCGAGAFALRALSTGPVASSQSG